MKTYLIVLFIQFFTSLSAFGGSQLSTSADETIKALSHKYIHLSKRGDKFYLPTGDCVMTEALFFKKRGTEWKIDISDAIEGYSFIATSAKHEGQTFHLSGVGEVNKSDLLSVDIKPHPKGNPYFQISGARITDSRPDDLWISESDKAKVKKMTIICPPDSDACQGCKEELEK